MANRLEKYGISTGIPQQKEGRRRIKDGGITNIFCSNCDEHIADIMHTDPNGEVDIPIQVKCDYCGDRSELLEVHGTFHIGHEPTGSIEIVDIDQQEDRVLFITHANKRPS